MKKNIAAVIMAFFMSVSAMAESIPYFGYKSLESIYGDVNLSSNIFGVSGTVAGEYSSFSHNSFLDTTTGNVGDTPVEIRYNNILDTTSVTVGSGLDSQSFMCTTTVLGTSCF